VREIRPDELLSQLEEMVVLFLASPAEQNAWVDETGVPAEEIALQYYDAIDAFLGRLHEHALIDGADEALLRELRAYVGSIQTTLFVDSEHFIDGWYVTDAAEWRRVRSLAQATLASLKRRIEEKAHPGS